jgi:hypothetical protein
VAVPAQELGLLFQPAELVRRKRDGDLAGAIEVAVDPQALDVAAQAGEVLLAEAFELLELVGEARRAVGQAVGDSA